MRYWWSLPLLLITACRQVDPAADTTKRLELELRSSQQLGLLLLDAARDGDNQRLQGLLFRGADVRVRDADGATVLHAFFSRRNWRLDERTLGLLLRAGVAVGAADRRGRTPLHLAAARGRAEPVRLLLEAGAPAAKCDAAGRTPLHQAARSGAVEVLELLATRGVSLDAPDARGATALTLAARAGECPAALWLAGRGAALDTTDDYGRGPLPALAGCCLEKLEAAEPGLSPAGPCRTRHRLRAATLQLAARRGEYQLAGRLVVDGAAVDEPGYFDPAIGAAGLTPLQVAVWAGQERTAKVLLELGASPRAQDGNGWTALDWAAFKNRPELARLLLAHGADPGRRAADGRRALERVPAAEREHWSRLLDRRANFP